MLTFALLYALQQSLYLLQIAASNHLQSLHTTSQGKRDGVILVQKKYLVYSCFRLSTGFLTAAFNAWPLTVNSAINNTEPTGTKNSHLLNSIFSAKPFNHLLVIHQAIGSDTTEEIVIKTKYSLVNSR